MTFKYIGRGDSIPGVPARDLSDDEAKQYGLYLINQSGLYEKIHNGLETMIKNSEEKGKRKWQMKV